MSIPKEPRQLMINIMYLVLTALLALNVSAEIFNAFKLVDKGLVESNKSLDEANKGLPKLIRDGAKKRESLATYAERIDPIRDASSEMSSYLQGIVDDMIEKTQGYVIDDETGQETDELRGKKDFDITTRTLVMDHEGNPGVGEEIKAKLLAYKETIMSYIDDEDKKAFANNVTVQVDDETWRRKDKKSWSHMNFDHMPLQAVIPIFTKYINDIKSTESAALNYLANEVGTDVKVTFDEFAVVSAPEKSYIIKGEQYKADLFLTASAGSDSNTGVSISVGGRNLPLNKEGKATFTQTASSTGQKSYTATATITNPVTGEKKSYKETFSYEVGERSVAISPTNMNVFYIGVNNPVEISAAGVNSNKINPTMGGKGGGSITKNGDGTYNVKVTRPTLKGEFATINVSADGLNASKNFRVKRIPDPTPMIGKNRGGSIKSGQLKISKGIFPVLQNFDFDAKCDIVGFTTLFAAKRKDLEISKNPGWKWGTDSKRFIDKAKPGDRFVFDNIKCKCPGDPAPRDLGNISFGVK